MSDNLTPARVVPPGRILNRELEARGWTQKDLAEIIKRPPQAINEIIQGTKQITPDTALELSEAFGTSPEFWNNLEANYRLNLAKKPKNNSDIQRRSCLYSLAPITELIKRQWINPRTDSIEDLEKAVCDFFKINSLDETPLLAVNFRHNRQLDPENSALIAWLRRVEDLAQQQEVGKYDRSKLQAAIPHLLTYAESEGTIAQVPSLLLELGIHFIIVPHLSKTYLDGATFYLGENPVIALTLRYNRIDCFWFTLLHELGHIQAGHQGIYLDDIDHLEPLPEETEANQKARDWLISPLAYENFISQTQPKFSSKAIEDFARTQKRHPGIVIGRLQHDEYIGYGNLRKYLIKVHPYLNDWIER
jgi:HTH-type transcriptional regulator / antitoxin HigA